MFLSRHSPHFLVHVLCAKHGAGVGLGSGDAKASVPSFQDHWILWGTCEAHAQGTTVQCSLVSAVESYERKSQCRDRCEAYSHRCVKKAEYETTGRRKSLAVVFVFYAQVPNDPVV